MYQAINEAMDLVLSKDSNSGKLLKKYIILCIMENIFLHLMLWEG
jgi:hypothetical protein